MTRARRLRRRAWATLKLALKLAVLLPLFALALVGVALRPLTAVFWPLSLYRIARAMETRRRYRDH